MVIQFVGATGIWLSVMAFIAYLVNPIFSSPQEDKEVCEEEPRHISTPDDSSTEDDESGSEEETVQEEEDIVSDNDDSAEVEQETIQDDESQNTE